MHTNEYTPALDLLATAQRILIVSHQNPDLDAIGASAGLAQVLADAGKEVYAFSPGPSLPAGLEIIGADKRVSLDWNETFTPDLVCMVDCSEENRVGEETHKRIKALADVPLLNIDHHKSNDAFGTVAIVEARAGSTAEILQRIVTAGGYTMSQAAATFLYTGILGDTGRFLFSTTPETYAAAAALLQAGADHHTVAREIHKSLSFSALQMYGEVLSNTVVTQDGHVVYAFTGQPATTDTEKNVSRIDTQVINHMLQMPNTEVGILFSRRASGSIRVSFRGWGTVDCAQIATHFGGGGHKSAAGCTVEAELDDAITQVLSYIEENYESLRQDDVSPQPSE